MPDKLPDRINGRELIMSNTLIINKGDDVRILPFYADPSYTLDIIFKFGDNNRRVLLSEVEGDRFYIKIIRPFKDGDSFSGGDGLNFSDDGEYEYYLRIGGTIIGDKDDWSVIFHYNIFREGIKNG